MIFGNYQQLEEEGTSLLPAAMAISAEQMMIDDVWKEISKQYVDPTYNGLGVDGWRQQRLGAIQQVSTLDLVPPPTTQWQH